MKDYYTVEHVTEYVPQLIPDKKIEFVPVEKIQNRVEYYPIERYSNNNLDKWFIILIKDIISTREQTFILHIYQCNIL